MFDIELIYTPYEEVREQIQHQDNPDEYINTLEIRFQVWGAEMLREVNLDALFFGEDMRGKVTP